MHGSNAHCLNCGQPLTGPYCSACGQKDATRILPLGHLLHDLIHELVHVDHHVFHTLWLLLSRPGLLTVEYLAGRRSRHLPPFRLYLITSFLLFLVLGTLTPRWLKLNNSGKGGPPQATLVVGNGHAAQNGKNPSGTKASTPFEQKLNQGAKKAAEHPGEFFAHVLALLPKVLFILLPLFGVLLKLLYLRRRVLYAAHLIFAVHLHTVAFLAFLATLALGFVPGLAGWNALVVFLGLPIYTLLALKRVHGQGWGKTLIKGALLGVSYFPLVISGTVGALLWALVRE